MAPQEKGEIYYTEKSGPYAPPQKISQRNLSEQMFNCSLYMKYSRNAGYNPGMTGKQAERKLEEYLKWHDNEDAIPFLGDFCLEAGVSKKEIQELGEKYRAVGKLLDRLEMMRENILQRGGLNKKLDRSFATFCLKQMGWKETSETESKHTIEFGGDIEKWAK